MKYIAVIFILLLASSALAAETSLSYRDRQIYSETYSLCRDIRSEHFALIKSIFNGNTADAALISLGQSLKMAIPFLQSSQDSEAYLQRGLISDYLEERLKSDGYIQALNNCFGEREDLKKAFTISMMVVDRGALVPAVIFAMAWYRALGKGYEKLSLRFPFTMMMVNRSMFLATAGAVIYEVRKTLKQQEPSVEEKAQLARFKQNLKAGTSQAQQEILQVAKELKREIHARMDRAQSTQERLELEGKLKIVEDNIAVIENL